MPRRLLREGILESRAVNSLSESAEILYRRLMSVVDDYGRFEADIDIIRARCFPLQLEKWSPKRVADHLHEISGSTSPQLKNGFTPSSTVKNGDCPLVTVYNVGAKTYLQINNFGQRIQSKPRYPEPGSSQLPINPEIDAKTIPANGHHSELPSWMLDESYVMFAELSKKLWPDILDEEITAGYTYHWKKFSMEQRLLATKNLRARVDAGEDGKFVKHMPDYLRFEWKRGPKITGKNGKSKLHQPSDTRYVD